ncbi:MAG TPA: FAD-binding protein [Actinomycetota bacterium]|nr:FAD-binding protein [Actinomycetota bacterium]
MKRDVADALRAATAEHRRLLIVGGRTHIDRGNRHEVDAELWTTQLDRLVAYDPAEMIAVVEAGMRVGELQRVLGEGGQEWPVDAQPRATVGGVIAAAVSSPRRLEVGHVRDTVVELELVTGDGRLIKSGARTVKNVTGYDLHRLATGSLGTLGVIVQVALKVRPLPRARRTLVVTGEEGLRLGADLLRTVPLPAAVLAEPNRVEVRLEGWPEGLEEQTDAARAVTSNLSALDDEPFPPRAIVDAPVVVEAAVPPSKIGAIVDGRDDWSALLGVGLVWFRLADANSELHGLRARVAEAGGIAPVIKGDGGLGDAPLPAPEVHRRLKTAFDPAGILAPGRFWGGI